MSVQVAAPACAQHEHALPAGKGTTRRQMPITQGSCAVFTLHVAGPPPPGNWWHQMRVLIP
jgi:hypothetical protein